ncbi:TetR/AcrR family transcriptional regulator [Pseudonocardiaceae bacterium YIM PH 21723]|nr:TetR/AcrR family transcriptional regulator [Pseudonocardiaceae bacterium YIM PH 21723]
MTTREEQKQATRAHILNSATTLLVERGYRALNTLAVQRAAGLSRGTLLHHFPTIQALTGALVGHLVELNEAVTQRAAEQLGPDIDPVDRALRALHLAMTSPSAQAEQELWMAARSDTELVGVLREAEREAGRDLQRVVDDLFGAEIVAHPRYPMICDLTITVLRGIAAAQPLRTSSRAAEQTLATWAVTIRTLLAAADY